MRGKSGPGRAGLFAPDFLPIELEDPFRLVAQERRLLFTEAIGKKDKALFVEGADLVGAELHGFLVLPPHAVVPLAYCTARKNQKSAAPVSSAARCRRRAKAAGSGGAVNGIDVVSVKIRAVSGNDLTCGERGLLQIWNLRESPSLAQKAMTEANTMGGSRDYGEFRIAWRDERPAAFSRADAWLSTAMRQRRRARGSQLFERHKRRKGEGGSK
jgi:hypothetical protein